MFIKRTTKVEKDELEDIIKKYDKYVKISNNYFEENDKKYQNLKKEN
jgi:pectate lyase